MSGQERSPQDGTVCFTARALLEGKKLGLTIQHKRDDGGGGAVILRLDNKEYGAILGEIDSRTEVELVREETN